MSPTTTSTAVTNVAHVWERQHATHGPNGTKYGCEQAHIFPHKEGRGWIKWNEKFTGPHTIITWYYSKAFSMLVQ